MPVDRPSDSSDKLGLSGTVATRPVTVLAVDDQAIFLRAARSLIAAMSGFEQVGEATSGPDALALAAELHPDLVLVDAVERSPSS